MYLLRQDMEKRRKQEIQRIESKKNDAIRALTQKHEKKYSDIKEYYSEITSTNLDIIRQLKDDLAEAKAQDAKTQREKMHQEELNARVQKPLDEANKAVKELKLVQLKHNDVKGHLQDCLAKTKEIESSIVDAEWEYEVKRQQFEYLEREKQDLFDNFNKLVYELHRKTGLRNLILEKKVETILEANETKDA